jgi:hypothetical protein
MHCNFAFLLFMHVIRGEHIGLTYFFNIETPLSFKYFCNVHFVLLNFQEYIAVGITKLLWTGFWVVKACFPNPVEYTNSILSFTC